MASKQELLESIKPGMKLTKSFFLKVYGYTLTDPDYLGHVLGVFWWEFGKEKMELAKRYYRDIVSQYEKDHDEMMKRVSDWYAKQKNRKGSGNEWEEQEKFLDLLQKKERLLNRLITIPSEK